MKPIKVWAAVCGLAVLLGSCDKKEKTVPVAEVKIDSEEISLTPGETRRLTASVYPEDADYDAVLWASSDETVAVVAEDGTVTAVAKGEAVVSASAGDVKAECTVTVTVPVGGVSLDKNELALFVGGESVRLEATVSPEDASDKSVVWSTSDPSVVTVADGLVSPVSAGVAVVSVEASGFKAECKVTVTVPVGGVSLDKNELSLFVGGESVRLEATVSPEDASDKSVVWSTSDPSVVTVADGLVSPVSAGVAVVSVEASGFKAECKVTVSVPAKKWEVGDYYEVDNVKGVVVWTSDDKVHGKIVSLDEAVRNQWSTGISNTGAKSETDGKANTEKVKDLNASLSAFPAFKWCVDHGDGWYFPSIYEVYLFMNSKSVIEPVLKAHGGSGLTDYYWSSTEGEEDESAALYGYFSNGAAKSYSDMKDCPEGDMMVRAMYQF